MIYKKNNSTENKVDYRRRALIKLVVLFSVLLACPVYAMDLFKILDPDDKSKDVQRAKFFEGVGKISTANMKGDDGKKYRNMIGNLQTVLFDQGLDKDMEFEADLSGMEYAYQTGYNPKGFIQVLQMLKKNDQTSEKKGSWFSTHPPLTDRIERCTAAMSKYPDAASLAVVRKRFAGYKKLF